MALAVPGAGRARVQRDVPGPLRRGGPGQDSHHAVVRGADPGVRLQPRAGHLGPRAVHARGHAQG